jgi:histidinol phosphatase-like PHP family hydrolase
LFLKMKFIDLHTHTIFSDGELMPSELVWRARAANYDTIALTDHIDQSNIDFVIPRITKISTVLARRTGLTVIPGAELTYVAPEDISRVAGRARRLGAKIIVVHGETVAEPAIPEGTNHAALLSNIDILAHPGELSEEDACLAKERGIYVEITTRSQHAVTNGTVLQRACAAGALMVMNTDTHGPEDLLTMEKAFQILKNAGVQDADIKETFDRMQHNASELILGRTKKR